MARLVYRVASIGGALGGGFQRETIRTVLDRHVDALICNAAAPAASPLYPGTASSCYSRDALKNDLRRVIEAGRRIAGPVILGNCEMAGADGNLNPMLEVAKEIFEELQVRDAQVAVIRSDVVPGIVIEELRADALRLVSAGTPMLNFAVARAGTVMAQMGIHPIVAALRHGAKYIFVGRVCDAALFAADMIRQGISPGLAYHTGHVLKGAASVCEPASASECLVAEIYDDGNAVFKALDGGRRCTPYSIALCSLDETSHPHLKFLPEGILATVDAEFFAVNSVAAGIRGSRLFRTRKTCWLSIRIEGVRQHGADNGSTFHRLVTSDRFNCNGLFPISYYCASGADWHSVGQAQADYFDVGDLADDQDLDERTLCAIEDAPQRGRSYGSHCLADIARVFRRESADTGRITIDLMFVSIEAYELALLSNVFCARNLAATLDLRMESIIGSYFVDSCRTIRIALEQPRETTPSEGGDGSGEQYQSVIERLNVPIYADPRRLATG
jgi:hypothetical protein